MGENLTWQKTSAAEWVDLLAQIRTEHDKKQFEFKGKVIFLATSSAQL